MEAGTSEASKSTMSDLFVENHASHDVAAVFYEDEGAGYFALYRVPKSEVIQQIQVYSRSPHPEVREDDVELFWSRDEEKAAISVWGRLRAVLDRSSRKETTCVIENPESQALEDRSMVALSPGYVDRKSFLNARLGYWQSILKASHPDVELSDIRVDLLGTLFLVARVDTEVRRAAVFEDDGQSGYLYIYSAEEKSIHAHVHVYDRSKSFQLTKEDVEVAWSSDECKCAVRISGRFHGIIDAASGQAIRSWFAGPLTPGISNQEWLRGFLPI